MCACSCVRSTPSTTRSSTSARSPHSPARNRPDPPAPHPLHRRRGRPARLLRLSLGRRGRRLGQPAQVGRIFGTETPGFTGDDENWTRAQIFAYAPTLTDTTLAGTYGSLTIGQGGAWTYALANNQVNVQNLAQGQTAIDTFTVEVADEFGASDTETISITVVGSNDAPVITSGPGSGAVPRARFPSATGTMAAFDPTGAQESGRWRVVRRGGRLLSLRRRTTSRSRNGGPLFEDTFAEASPRPAHRTLPTAMRTPGIRFRKRRQTDHRSGRPARAASAPADPSHQQQRDGTPTATSILQTWVSVSRTTTTSRSRAFLTRSLARGRCTAFA